MLPCNPLPGRDVSCASMDDVGYGQGETVMKTIGGSARRAGLVGALTLGMLSVSAVGAAAADTVAVPAGGGTPVGAEVSAGPRFRVSAGPLILRYNGARYEGT